MKKVAVISDPQLNMKDGTLDSSISILKICFKHMLIDALVVCGDITEHAHPIEMDAFLDTCGKFFPAENVFFVPGNMDRVYSVDGEKAFLEVCGRYYGKKREHLYFAHEEVTYSLIGISPEPVGGGTITDAQLTFLDGHLKNAAERNIPALVLCHYQIKNTIPGVNWEFASLGSDSAKVQQILEKHGGKTVFFTGHTHMGLTAGSVVTYKNVTYISTPSICMPDTEHYNSENNNSGTGFIVEINEHDIYILGYDFMNDEALMDFNGTFE
jgi:predicted phosphodiesterase